MKEWRNEGMKECMNEWMKINWVKKWANLRRWNQPINQANNEHMN